MEAASRGARDSAVWTPGTVVALLPGFDPDHANRYADVVIPTGLDHLRNSLVAQADAVVAIGGGAGTLTEIGLAWIYRRLIVALRVDGWSGKLADLCVDDRIRYEDTPRIACSARTAPTRPWRWSRRGSRATRAVTRTSLGEWLTSDASRTAGVHLAPAHDVSGAGRRSRAARHGRLASFLHRLAHAPFPWRRGERCSQLRKLLCPRRRSSCAPQMLA